ASWDETARLWDAASGRELRVLHQHRGAVGSAGFSPDGQTVLTVSADGTARLWDAASGRQLRILYGHVKQVTSGQFSPDGKTVLTTGTDGTARLWRCDACRPIDEIATEVAARVGRELTGPERQRFGVPDSLPRGN
ncbi:MAG: hypothetical protein KDI53_00560, partial [Candidatus Accumulibacter sp.]|nr:hypothetical protein [Accumulibacter sp.]